MAEKQVQSRREESLRYASLHYEEQKSLQEISKDDERHKDIKTISRIMNSGRKIWWQLKVLPLGETSETTIDETLSRQLREATVFSNAIVVNCSNVSHAQRDEFPPDEAEGPAAYVDSDILHLRLSRHAASYLLGRLGHGYKVGIGSGRASTYTADFCCKDGRDGKARRLIGVEIFSLVGGVRDIRWGQEPVPELKDVPANLDADEGASLLAEALGIQKHGSYLHLVNLPISINTNDLPTVVKAIANHLFEMPDRLDMMISGVGVLNTGHHFIVYRQGAGLSAISDDLKNLQELQLQNPAMLEGVGEVCHRLFWCGDGATPPDVQKIIEEVNSKVIAVPFNVISEAKELLLIAGGRQKLPVLTRLSRKAPSNIAQLPFKADRITLVTDSWTAGKILNRKRS